MAEPLDPLDLIDIDALLSDEERQIRDLAREWVVDNILPNVEDWYEHGEFPARELATELGKLGFLGMQLPEIGGLGAVAYGLVELELEAGDSGLRSFVSVHERARDVRDPHVRVATSRRTSGCRACSRARRSGASGCPSPTAAATPGRCARSRSATATTGSCRARRCGSRTAASPTSRSSGRTPTTGSAGSSCPCDAPGFSAPDIHKKMSLRASVTSELVMDEVRLPAGAVLPDVTGLARAALLPERGALRDHLGRDGRRARLLRVVA